MPNGTTTSTFPETEFKFRLGHISWGAIFAGAIVAVVMHIWLTLLGLSFGLAVFEPGAQGQLGTISIGAGIWMVFSAILSLFAGGWIAGKMSGGGTPLLGFLHGAVTWGLVMLFTFYLMTSAIGGLISGAAGLVGRGITAAGPAAGGDISQLIGGVSAIAGDPAAQRELSDTFNRISERGGDVTPADRESVIGVLTRAGVPRAQAEDTANTLINQYRGIAQAGPIAGQVADTLSSAALWTALAMFLGLLASGFGGWIGIEKTAVSVSAKGKGALLTKFRRGA